MKRKPLRLAVVLALAAGGAVSAQAPPGGTPPPLPPATISPADPLQQSANYIVGAQDVLVITSYDQPDLTGKFTVESDGTFTYPLIGRIRVSGMTLRAVEDSLRQELIQQGFFKDPQIAVTIESYRSQKIYIVGEVRTPGAYPLSGDMRLVEALALAGSTTPTASGEAVIVREADKGFVVDAAPPLDADPHGDGDGDKVVRVDLRELENGAVEHNVRLQNGDTIFVLRAESVYVFGQVRNPGAYPLRQRETTVLQALSLAGGVTDRGSTGRIQIVRIVDGKKHEVRADLTDFVLPRDTIIVPERFF